MLKITKNTNIFLIPDSNHPTLQLSLSTPCIEHGDGNLQRINSFYIRRQKRIEAYYTNKAAKALKHGNAEVISSIALDYSVTQNDCDCLSLLFFSQQSFPPCRDKYYSSEVWSLKSGALLQERDILSLYGFSRDEVFKKAYDELSSMNIRYYKNLRFRLRRYYHGDNYYIENGRPVLFYQADTLCDIGYGMIKIKL